MITADFQHSFHRFARLIGAGLTALSAIGCQSYPPLPTVAEVDLPRFMGDWFVVAHIPASAELEAFNGVETYRLEADGRSVATTYAFRDGGFDGPLQVLEPTGYVEDIRTNATWGMQFFWPFWAEYLITYLDDDYSVTIIGRSARDYAWIMARTPELEPERYAALLAELARQGYDPSRVRRVPQRWPDPMHPASARLASRADGEATAARFVPPLRPESDYGAFPTAVAVDGERLVLNGAGLCEWGIFGVDLYRAALYLSEPCADAGAVLRTSARAVVHLHFVRSLTREQLIEAFTASVRATAGADSGRYAAALRELGATMPGVGRGDSLTFVIDPDASVEVFASDRARGVVEDADFARLFLELYVGEQPPSADLKVALLGGV